MGINAYPNNGAASSTLNTLDQNLSHTKPGEIAISSNRYTAGAGASGHPTPDKHEFMAHPPPIAESRNESSREGGASNREGE